MIGDQLLEARSDLNKMALAGLRVLIVEDEPIVAMLIEDTLTELGCVVTDIASRLEEALQMVSNCDFDAAILDVNLAGQQTYPVAERLLQRGIPFAFATGYGASGLPGEYRHLPILAKPFRQVDLQLVLEKLSAN